MDQARQFGLEGLIGKRAGSRYEVGPTLWQLDQTKVSAGTGIRHRGLHEAGRIS